ncbi:VanZ family protein [Streptomyces sp. WMMC897]|uniref:VanZ family protein n=1 Tax=Streptomyces sp. WMMC897 TaxID=3014782 RepID=UPI0022B6DBB2|nr:VanZ family protein [Streptomyces sp. WMMC897]MCZ7416956.1 VanZ family protein [Streptomyces sp. WMMC897]
MPHEEPHRRTGRAEGRAAVRLRTTGRVVLGGYLLAVGLATLRPRTVPWVEPANLTPFDTIRSVWLGGAAEAVLSLGTGLLLLAPLGVLLPLAAGMPAPRVLTFVRTVSVTAVLSLGIEVARTTVPGQSADVDALILNATGAGLVHALLYPVVRRRVRRAVRTSAAEGDGDEGEGPAGGGRAALRRREEPSGRGVPSRGEGPIPAPGRGGPRSPAGVGTGV